MAPRSSTLAWKIPWMKELNEVGKESIKSTTDIIYEKFVGKYQNEPLKTANRLKNLQSTFVNYTFLS